VDIDSKPKCEEIYEDGHIEVEGSDCCEVLHDLLPQKTKFTIITSQKTRQVRERVTNVIIRLKRKDDRISEKVKAPSVIDIKIPFNKRCRYHFSASCGRFSDGHCVRL